MREGTLCSLRSFKCVCPVTQKAQGCGSLSEASSNPLLYEQTAKALAILYGCRGLPELSPFAYVISTLFSSQLKWVNEWL